MTDFIQVITTTGDHELAKRIAIELVDRSLAACVQVNGPMHSTYRWAGKVESAEEWQCVAKTTTQNFSAIETLLAEIHPYDVPELIAVPIAMTSQAYGAWLTETIRNS